MVKDKGGVHMVERGGVVGRGDKYKDGGQGEHKSIVYIELTCSKIKSYLVLFLYF